MIAVTTRLLLAAEQPELRSGAPVAVVHAYSQVEQQTACGRTLQGLELLAGRRWPPSGRGLARCRDCDHAVEALQATGEPIVPTVMVEWLRSTGDAAHEGGGHIGDRHYQGRAGWKARIRADDAEILAAGGYVKRVGEQA